MSLRSVNLNLLPVLQALLRERNVSRASASLHLTQSAVSAALSRLREALHDPLLVKIGHRMELTRRASELIGPVDDACETLKIIWEPPRVDPQVLQRVFTITTTDYTGIVIMPAMIESLRAQAPHVSMQFLSLPPDIALSRPPIEIDFIMLTGFGLDRLRDARLKTMPLFQDDFVAVVGSHHRLAQTRKATPEEYLAEPHVIFFPGDFTPSDGYQRNIVAKVQQFGLLPFAAALTDCVVIMPRRIVLQVQGVMPLAIIYELSPVIQTQVFLTWSKVHDADPGHRWFRNLLRDTVGDA
ncbi:MAG: LysR family transcriptional regulator [Pseudomonadota bacterium]|nr:LysR family transcriptional regulator [Pseudomonadota bacterium]